MSYSSQITSLTTSSAKFMQNQRRDSNVKWCWCEPSVSTVEPARLNGARDAATGWSAMLVGFKEKVDCNNLHSSVATNCCIVGTETDLLA